MLKTIFTKLFPQKREKQSPVIIDITNDIVDAIEEINNINDELDNVGYFPQEGIFTMDEEQKFLEPWIKGTNIIENMTEKQIDKIFQNFKIEEESSSYNFDGESIHFSPQIYGLGGLGYDLSFPEHNLRLCQPPEHNLQLCQPPEHNLRLCRPNPIKYPMTV